MTPEPPNSLDRSATLRRAVYGILIALAVGNVAGRIFAVNSVDLVGLEKHLQKTGRPDWKKTRPFLSANDRSRWATVRAIVEHGTYEIDKVIAEPGWDTIDMVRHRGGDGEYHFYSSKPPLLATVLAGPYWIVHKLTGCTLGTHPYAIGRFLLLLVNGSVLLAYLALVARLVERFGTTDWGRIVVVAAAALGTFLTTFAVSLNNHLIAALFVAGAAWWGVAIWYDGRRDARTFALCGLCAALAAANELPALSLFAGLAAVLLWKAPRPTLWAFLPASLVVVAASFGTNYIAHDTWRPPYAHRSKTNPDDNWYEFTVERGGKQVPSYWTNPSGIDKGEPSLGVYILHSLVGHHGIFSLTPFWLLTVWGCVLLARGKGTRELAIFIAGLSLVCIGFYTFGRPPLDRNYGGMTSGFRWVFWLAPLWLLAAVPAADRLAGTRSLRALGLVLLALSVLSASYPTWNPWTHPWLMHFFLDRQWVTLPT